MIKVLIADDHPLIRAGLKATLKDMDEVTLVGEVQTFSEALRCVAELHPDLLILDLEMPGGEACPTVLEAKATWPELKVLILSSKVDSAGVKELLRAKISGYMVKEDAPNLLRQAVTTIVSGATWFSQRVMAEMTRATDRHDPLAHLSDREREVYQMIYQGLDNSTIADQLSMAAQSVRNIVSFLYKKLKVKGRVEAIVLAQNNRYFG